MPGGCALVAVAAIAGCGAGALPAGVGRCGGGPTPVGCVSFADTLIGGGAGVIPAGTIAGGAGAIPAGGTIGGGCTPGSGVWVADATIAGGVGCAGAIPAGGTIGGGWTRPGGATGGGGTAEEHADCPASPASDGCRAGKKGMTTFGMGSPTAEVTLPTDSTPGGSVPPRARPPAGAVADVAGIGCAACAGGPNPGGAP